MSHPNNKGSKKKKNTSTLNNNSNQQNQYNLPPSSPSSGQDSNVSGQFNMNPHQSTGNFYNTTNNSTQYGGNQQNSFGSYGQEANTSSPNPQQSHGLQYSHSPQNYSGGAMPLPSGPLSPRRNFNQQAYNSTGIGQQQNHQQNNTMSTSVGFVATHHSSPGNSSPGSSPGGSMRRIGSFSRINDFVRSYQRQQPSPLGAGHSMNGQNHFQQAPFMPPSGPASPSNRQSHNHNNGGSNLLPHMAALQHHSTNNNSGQWQRDHSGSFDTNAPSPTAELIMRNVFETLGLGNHNTDSPTMRGGPTSPHRGSYNPPHSPHARNTNPNASNASAGGRTPAFSPSNSTGNPSPRNLNSHNRNSSPLHAPTPKANAHKMAMSDQHGVSDLNGSPVRGGISSPHVQQPQQYGNNVSAALESPYNAREQQQQQQQQFSRNNSGQMFNSPPSAVTPSSKNNQSAQNSSDRHAAAAQQFRNNSFATAMQQQHNVIGHSNDTIGTTGMPPQANNNSKSNVNHYESPSFNTPHRILNSGHDHPSYQSPMSVLNASGRSYYSPPHTVPSNQLASGRMGVVPTADGSPLHALGPYHQHTSNPRGGPHHQTGDQFNSNTQGYNNSLQRNLLEHLMMGDNTYDAAMMLASSLPHSPDTHVPGQPYYTPNERNTRPATSAHHPQSSPDFSPMRQDDATASALLAMARQNQNLQLIISAM